MLYACLPQAGALLYAVWWLWREERTPEQLKGESD
jgi:hypothetical protein